MNPEYWRERWREGRIGFHEPADNAWLVEHGSKLGAGSTVFVPLCGKSRDLALLASRGHRVVGVDVSDIAARAFFAERGLEPTVEREGAFEAHRAGDVTILVGDVFDVHASAHPPFEATYDRAALIALPPHEQARYAATLRELSAPAARLLLVTFAFGDPEVEGPPWSTPTERVRELFEPSWSIEHLGDRAALDDRAKFREAGVTWATESAWLLTKQA